MTALPAHTPAIGHAILVGDQTWAAPIGDTGASLEAAVGLEHATADRPG